MTRSYYNAEITVRLRVMVASDSPEAALEAARRAAALRPGVRSEDIRDVSVSRLSPAEEMRAADRRVWQESQALLTGNSNQRERWSSGDLPEVELLELARNELFKPFAFMAPRRKMVFAAIPHPRDASGIWQCVRDQDAVSARTIGAALALDDLVEWSTTPRPDMTSAEWRTLSYIQQATSEVLRHPWMARAPQHTAEVGVQPREHRGRCKRCSREASERSALVSIQWAGRVLSREYVL